MKNLYLLLLLLPIYSYGQITTPVMRANFGIDADLRANYYNSLVTAAGDDWFVNSAGSGQGVIDTTGAAAIVARYNTTPSSRSSTFSRIMKQNPFSVVNNRLLIDAVFHRDYHGNDSTIFAAGSNKNGMSPANWSCPVSQSIPDKNDILDVFTHVRRAGPDVRDSLWMFGGISIENTTGNRYFDFELYQTDFYYDRSTRTFRNFGRDAGHTSWTFDVDGNILTAGDIIFSAEYSSSSLTFIEARIWVNRSDLSITPQQFAWGGAFDGAASGATFGYASIVPITAGAFYTGLQSANGVWAGPFSLILGDNSLTTSYVARQYMEFSVNMTKLGLDPAAYSANACGSPFRRVLVKTRSSTSFSAELKDFVAPFRLFDYPNVDAFADIIYYCGAMPTVPLNIFNTNTSSTYTWSTSDGHISGSNIGSTINVDAPGTYFVEHQLHSSCPVYSKDSVRILYDPVCLVLDLQITDLQGSSSNEGISLLWKIKNNEYAKNIQIEFSPDGNLFFPAGELNASSRSGDETYSFSHTGYYNLSRMLYYRIRAAGENGQWRYSNIIKIGKDGSGDFLFPIPSKGQVWLKTTVKGNLCYTISDGSGHKVIRDVNTFSDGIISLNTATLCNGLYFVSVKSGSNTNTYKLMIKK